MKKKFLQYDTYSHPRILLNTLIIKMELQLVCSKARKSKDTIYNTTVISMLKHEEFHSII